MLVRYFATLLSGVLMARNVKGSLFWGIIATTLIGIPLGVTVFPDLGCLFLLHKIYRLSFASSTSLAC